MEVITMEHGSGGAATDRLIKEIFSAEFYGDDAGVLEDAAVVDGAERIAVTTDSFVVYPPEYPGGDIGRLCVCGTVNDLLMRGAVPKCLTCGFILQEGLSVELLRRIAHSLAETAREAGVSVVAGDTKVVEGGGGGLFINTAGVGSVPEGRDVSAVNIRPGDAVIISGSLGEHHAAILSQRLSVTNGIESDNAPLVRMVEGLFEAGIDVHAMRDVTRGGLATVMRELAAASGTRIELNEADIPVTQEIRSFCGLLGLDPLYMGNEGKLVAIVPQEQAEKAVNVIKNCSYGDKAAVIGRVLPLPDGAKGKLVLKTELGGTRILEILQGEGLPRIC